MVMKKPMSGWKMKSSAFAASIGTLLIGLSQVVPSPKAAPWLQFIGIAIDGAAATLGIWGAGHKMEKNRDIILDETKRNTMKPNSGSVNLK
jgi:hypothetical protein